MTLSGDGVDRVPIAMVMVAALPGSFAREALRDAMPTMRRAAWITVCPMAVYVAMTDLIATQESSVRALVVSQTIPSAVEMARTATLE